MLATYPRNFKKGQPTRMLMFHDLKKMPKIDLHRHFEGSLRLETLVQIAKDFKLENIPVELEALRPHVQVTDDPPDALTFLAKFEVLRRFYRSPEIIRQLAHEIVADAVADNVHYLELRFSPQALANAKGYPLEEVTDWVIEAVNNAAKQYPIKVNLIIALVRHNSFEEGQKVAQIAFDRAGKGIVGLDLAGDEVNYSSIPFQEIFLEAKRLGLGVTVHAGEWTNAIDVQQAIEILGANRVGHGVNIIRDPNVVALVKEKNVALEICLTSNKQTGSVYNLAQHPLKKFLHKNIPVTLNTDDPTISNITLTDEYHIAMDTVGLTYDELCKMTLTAVDAAFATEAEKQELRQHFQTRLYSSTNSH